MFTPSGGVNRAGTRTSILERIEFARARHRYSEWPQHVQHLHGAGMLGDDFRPPPVRHRALIEISAAQRHAARLQPCIHFGANESPLGFFAAEPLKNLIERY